MYEQSAGWNAYYRDDDPVYRRRQLDERCMLEPDDGANRFRLWLYEARYVDPAQPGRSVDRFLFQCVNFVQLYNSARIFRRGAAKEVRASLAMMGFEEAGKYGEAGERALYWELRNAVSRYFKTCESSGYRRGVFGLVGAGEGRLEHVCRDAWPMSLGLSRRAGLTGEMALWNRAVRDSHSLLDAGAAGRFDALERRMNDRR